MPDLLAHALIAYTLATLLATRYDWLSPTYVTVAMAGAFVPDLAKATHLVSNAAVESLLGHPFDWFALHTAGGAVLSIAIGITVVERNERRRVAALLALGAASHLVADALLLKPGGRSYAVLWPLTQYHPPTPGLYLSTEPGPAIAAAAAALLAWYVVRWQESEPLSTS